MSPTAKIDGSEVSKPLGIDRDEIFLEIQAEIRDRPKFHRQSVEGKKHVGIKRCRRLGARRLDKDMAEMNRRIPRDLSAGRYED